MSPPPSRATRELLRCYALAAPGEHNLARLLHDQPDLAAGLGVVLDLDRDDAELALQIAPAVGRLKRLTARAHASDRTESAAAAAATLSRTARQGCDRVEVDADLLLGDLLADNEKKYVAFEVVTARVSVHRHVLVRARPCLRGFLDLAAFVDERGVHFAWRAGRGGLHLRPQIVERGAEVLLVDLLPPREPTRVCRPAPALLADVLAELGLT